MPPLMKHDFTKYGPLMLYNKRGQLRTCYSEAEWNQAKQDGFVLNTCPYLEFPKTMYHRKTGATKSVGHVDWDEDRNMAAELALGPDWTSEVVPEPEPEPAKSATAGIGLDSTVLLLQINATLQGLQTQMAESAKQYEELERAVSELAGARTALDLRLSELENVLSEPALELQSSGKAKAK